MNHVANAAENKNSSTEVVTEKTKERFLLDGNMQLPDIEICIPANTGDAFYADEAVGLFGIHPEGATFLTRPPRNYLESSAVSAANDVRSKTDEPYPAIAFGNDGVAYRAPKEGDLQIIRIDDTTGAVINLGAGADSEIIVGSFLPNPGDQVYILGQESAARLLGGDDKDSVIGDAIEQEGPYFSATFETGVAENMKRQHLKRKVVSYAVRSRLRGKQPKTRIPGDYFESMRELGLKQLAKVVAQNHMSDTYDDQLEPWIMENIVVPRSTQEAVTESRQTIEQQRDEQIAIFKSNVDYFVNQSSDTGAAETGSETEPADTQELHTVPPTERQPGNMMKNLAKRFQQIMQRFKGEDTGQAFERDDPILSLQHRSRAVGVTALMTHELSTHTPDQDKFGDLARNWSDIFDQFISAGYRDVEMHEIRKEVGPLLEGKGTYYKGNGVWEIDPLNPPTIADAAELIELITQKSQPPLHQQTSTSSFDFVKRSSSEQTNK